APAPTFLGLLAEKSFVSSEAQRLGDEVCERACAAFGPVERGDHSQEVCALALARRATEDVQARRNQTLLDLDHALPQFEHAAVSLLTRLLFLLSTHVTMMATLKLEVRSKIID